jgi:hypothetical protein
MPRTLGPPKLRSLLPLLLGLVLVLPATEAAAVVNPMCSLSGNHWDCPLLNGENDYQAVFSVLKPYLVENIQIHNQTRTNFQLDWVRGNSTDPYWGEFSVYLDLFATRQDVPGIGEVASRDWDPFVKVLVGTSWDPAFAGRGLIVAPGQTVILHNNADAMLQAGLKTSTINYTVKFRPLVQGVRSFRQPRVDQPISCNSGNQWTMWSPWRNTSGHAWRTDGATIYAVVPSGNHTVDAACVYVLNTSGAVRWSYCSGINQRGLVSFPRKTIQPNEYLAAQARHRCNAPGVWDWAAFLHVF